MNNAFAVGNNDVANYATITRNCKVTLNNNVYGSNRSGGDDIKRATLSNATIVHSYRTGNMANTGQVCNNNVSSTKALAVDNSIGVVNYATSKCNSSTVCIGTGGGDDVANNAFCNDISSPKGGVDNVAIACYLGGSRGCTARILRRNNRVALPSPTGPKYTFSN